MDNFTTVFRQLLNQLPRREFKHDAAKGRYNRYCKHFTVWNQFVANLYAIATNRDSLRDIEMGLKAERKTWSTFGLKNISRSQLAYANKKRDYMIFKKLYYHLLSKCENQQLHCNAVGLGKPRPKKKFRFKNKIAALDSTTISLCLSLFPWSDYGQKKGALKMHTLLDLGQMIPTFASVTKGKMSDIRAAKQSPLPLSPDSILVMDRAYTDFEWFDSLTKQKVYFITRAKIDMAFEIIGQHKEIRNKRIVADDVIRMTGRYTFKKYPHNLRLIELWDDEKNTSVYFLTNNFKLAATTIASAYKARWDIEIFFKWVKQNLKIKAFYGTSENAVKTQIWTAIIFYLLLSYIKFQTRYDGTILKFCRIIRNSLFKNKDIIDLLWEDPDKWEKGRDPCVQRVLIDLSSF